MDLRLFASDSNTYPRVRSPTTMYSSFGDEWVARMKLSRCVFDKSVGSSSKSTARKSAPPTLCNSAAGNPPCALWTLPVGSYITNSAKLNEGKRHELNSKQGVSCPFDLTPRQGIEGTRAMQCHHAFRDCIDAREPLFVAREPFGASPAENATLLAA